MCNPPRTSSYGEPSTESWTFRFHGILGVVWWFIYALFFVLTRYPLGIDDLGHCTLFYQSISHGVDFDLTMIWLDLVGERARVAEHSSDGAFRSVSRELYKPSIPGFEMEETPNP